MTNVTNVRLCAALSRRDGLRGIASRALCWMVGEYNCVVAIVCNQGLFIVARPSSASPISRTFMEACASAIVSRGILIKPAARGLAFIGARVCRVVDAGVVVRLRLGWVEVR